jgi:hypothetical protein
MKDVNAHTQIKVNVYADYNSSVITRAQTIDILPEIVGGVFGTGLFGTAVFGLDTVATTIEQGSRLGRAQAIQLEFIGPNVLDTDTLGRRWGLNSIGYKFKRRNIKG